MTGRDTLRLLLILNIVPLVILAGVGIAVYEGRIGIRLPTQGITIIGLLCVGALLSTVLGFFAAPAVERARSRNRQRIAFDRETLHRPLGAFRRLRTHLGILLRRLLGAVLAVESLGVHLALFATLIAILGVAGLGVWLAYQMATGQA